MAIGKEKSSASVFLDTTSAQYALDQLNKKIDTYDAKLKQVGNTAREISSLEKDRATLAQKALSIQDQIAKGLGSTLTQQKKYLQDLNSELSKLPVGTQQYEASLKKLGNASGVFLQMKKNLEGVTKAQDETTKSGNFFTRKLDDIKAFFLGGALEQAAQASFGLIKDFVLDSVKAFEEAEKTVTSLKLTLENLNKSSSFPELKQKAEEIAKQFKTFGSVDVLKGFDRLIAVGGLTEKQMSDLLVLTANFAAKSNKSFNDAIDDVVTALTGKLPQSLKQYSITLEGVNDVQDRAGRLIDVLGKKVEGAGEAFLNTRAGFKKAISQDIKDTKLAVGDFISNGIPLMIDASSRATNIIERTFDPIDETFARLQGRITAFASLMQTLGTNAANAAVKIRLSLGAASGTNATFGVNEQDAEKERQKNEEARKKAEEDNKKAADDAARKAKEAADRLAKLREELEKNKFNISIGNLSDLDRELAEVDRKYADWIERAQGHFAELKEIYEQHGFERLLVIQKYGRKEVDEYAKSQKELTEVQDNKLKENIKKLTELLKNNVDKLFDNNSEASTDERGFKKQQKAFENDLTLRKSYGKKRLQAQLDIIDQEEHDEVDAHQGELIEFADIDKKYNEQRKQAEKDFLIGNLQAVLEYSQQVVGIFQQFADARTAQENRRLDQELKSLDKQKTAYQHLLNAKVISQQTFNKKVSELDKEAENKKEELAKKEFERNKKLQIALALINGAQGIVATFAAKPGLADILTLGVARAIQVGFVVAATAAQIALISKQKYAKGGILPEGPSHRNKGIKLVDGQTGQVRGEVEGGEPILSKKTYANNKGIVDALLTSSRNGGEKIQPSLQNKRYKSFDYTGIARTIQTIRRYESGGILPGQSLIQQSPQSSSTQNPIPVATLEQTLQLLILQLRTPQKNYVLFDDIQAAKDRLDQIQKDSIFK